jgi:hypothetical protein
MTARVPLMSLVLVYAGTPTIFANFRTFIQLYLIIFHHYIALYITTLHRNSTLHLYIVTVSFAHFTFESSTATGALD